MSSFKIHLLSSFSKKVRNINWHFNISNLSKLQFYELFYCSLFKNQNSVTKTKFLVSDLAGQPDLVKKQREKDFGEGHLCIIWMWEILQKISLSVLVHNSAFCIEYFIMAINNVLKYCRIWRNGRSYTK